MNAISSQSPSRRRLFPLWFFAVPLVVLVATKLKPNAENFIQRDVLYGVADGQDLRLDVFEVPGADATTALRPAVLLVHGGGWAAGDKRDFDDLGRGLAGAGFVTFSANYRLVKGKTNPYPAQIDDVQRAVRWIRAHAAQFRIDPKRLGAMGASAGGHLVSLLGTTDTRDNSDRALAAYSSRVACVVDINGPADLTSNYPKPAKGSNENVEKLVTDLIAKPRSDVAAYREASPIFHLNRKTVPFLIFHGDQDPIVPVEQSRRLEEALKKNGTESELVIFAGEGHGLAEKKNIETLISKTFTFFRRHLMPIEP